jgi:uncharacterized damage-inducible protein DinB
MTGRARLLVLLCIASVAAPAVRAQQTPAPSESGLRAELAAELAAVEKKLVGLAEAMPPEKYSWRPAEGVRSVGEVFVHVAGGNYLLPSMMGIKPPAGIGPGLEQIVGMEKALTEKSKVIENLKTSFEHARKAVLQSSDADLEKKIDFFGRQRTARSTFVLLTGHAHEHMGQAIAYARMNGVTPPWSEGGPPPAKKSGNSE